MEDREGKRNGARGLLSRKSCNLACQKTGEDHLEGKAIWDVHAQSGEDTGLTFLQGQITGKLRAALIHCLVEGGEIGPNVHKDKEKRSKTNFGNWGSAKGHRDSFHWGWWK